MEPQIPKEAWASIYQAAVLDLVAFRQRVGTIEASLKEWLKKDGPIQFDHGNTQYSAHLLESGEIKVIQQTIE